MTCGEHCYLQGQDVLLRPPPTCQTGVLRLLISPEPHNPSASTRCSAENHETTLIPLGYPGHSLAGPSASHLPPLAHPRPVISGAKREGSRPTTGGQVKTVAAARQLSHTETSAQKIVHQLLKLVRPPMKKNSLVVVRGIRRVSPQQILSGQSRGRLLPCSSRRAFVSYGKSLTTGPRARPSPGEGPHVARSV